MAKPLNVIKKIRSLDEAITRGGQAISVYREQRRGTRGVPTDEEFVGFIDAVQFGAAPIIAESLWQKFYKNADKGFFTTFQNSDGSIQTYMNTFGREAADRVSDAGRNIVDGRINLLGLKDLYVGSEIDWHREPLSGKQSPLKHWKEFDDVETQETGNRKILWELNRHQHFFTLGAAYWLSGDEKFAEVFVQHLESWMEQNPPGLGVNWSSSLEISLHAMSWIWAFHFFKNSEHWTPERFKKALKYLYLHGRHIEKYLSKYYSPNTHLTGEALGLYYLGTQLPFLTRAKHWEKTGEKVLLDEVTRQILPDGVYFEQSTWYQRYTVDFFAHFSILRSLSAKRDLSPETARFEKRLQTAYDFLMQVTQPDGTTPLIGDDDGGRMLPITLSEPDDFRGSLALGAAIFGRGDHKYVAGPASEEIFWLMGPAGIRSYDAMEKMEPGSASKDFTDGGYYVMRDGFEDTDNCLIVDCGEVGSLSGGHGHADALSIELAVRGTTVLVDSGTYTYHDSPELRDNFRSSLAHNTMAVDGRSSSQPGNTFGWTTRADAVRKTWISEDRFDYFEGSHNGYERLAKAATHTRSILFLKGDYWIMRDLVETTGKHDFSLDFHYNPKLKPQIADNGSWIGDDVHRIFTFGDYGAWRQKESCVSRHHGDKVSASLMSFSSTGFGTQEFFTFILPVTAGTIPPEVSEVSAETGRAFVVKYAGYSDVFLFNEDTGQFVETVLFNSNFRSSWARLSEDETMPDEFVLIDGNRLSVGGHEIFDEPEIAYASARRLGNELYIRTEKMRRTASLARIERRKRDRRQPSSDRRYRPAPK